MTNEPFRWLAAVIAAHQNHEVIGRTRLQKEIKLLQRLGLPTHYHYTIHFYGPYSEGVQSEIGLLEALGFVEEELNEARSGKPYYTIQVVEGVDLPEIEPFRDAIQKMEGTDAIVLELAATYDVFRELGDNHEKANERLRRKKGKKCDNGNDKKALELLGDLGLPFE